MKQYGENQKDKIMIKGLATTTKPLTLRLALRR